ncbi:MAG: thiamine pyrophosphate-binding protein [Oscillospiraceae bacterium]|jgi:acetolactate synthase-1/2/3 large subunit|nr:thiamine pyrophosphate-binding protein [Oscillospiraceae bacterium]
MKVVLSEYVADFLAANGVTDVFSVVGGGAMVLNDALGHHPRLRVVYNHHEQACAIAAEAYARRDNRIAAVCVTSGPGGTNAVTGVLCGWLDSIPMLVISGQVRYETCARSTGLPLRAMGDQEYDITRAVAAMTKYCEMVADPRRIRYCLEKALYLAKSGRPGPCWLDIPLDVQGAPVDPGQLPGYDPAEDPGEIPPPAGAAALAAIEKIGAARRPVLYAGSGIRHAGCHGLFLRAAEALGVPVATCWNSIDLLWDDHPLYAGRGGAMGDRAGNFAVQNSDLLIAVGNRLSIRQVGYNWGSWARAAYKIMVDIDPAELRKPSIAIDMPIHAHAGDFFGAILAALPGEGPLFCGEAWRAQCRRWKRGYPVVLPRHCETAGKANVYCFVKELSRRLPEGRHTVAGNGSACVVGSQAWEIKRGQRFYVQSGAATMGYDLPAAIGACLAGKGEDIVLVTGEGSLQMNLQELQTIVHHGLPVKIFVLNNGGYHSMRQTQANLFPARGRVGIGPESGDLSFPALERLAHAYRIAYFRIETNRDMALLDTVLARPSCCLCEVVVSTEQAFEPKSSAKRLPGGGLYSPPLEDLAPFLPREELLANMFIPLIEEEGP